MIEKITDQNLERYDSRLKEWCDRKFFKKGNYGKYQTTEEAGAVAFYPAPNTPLEGKIKFSFKETMPTSGNKGPENSSTITGVNSVDILRCGKNLISVNFNSASKNGLIYTKNIDNSVTVSGTATEDTYFNFNGMTVLSKNLKLEGTYTLSGAPNNSENNYRLVCFKDELSSSGENGSGISFSLSSKTRIWFSFFVKEGFPGSGNTVTFYPQLEFGTTATLFEPYEGINYTINLGNTYYGGEIDLATGVMTVTHNIFVIDETTKITTSGYDEGTDAYRIGYYLPNKEITSSGFVVPSGYACDIMSVVMNPSSSGSLCFGLASGSYLTYIRFPKQLIGASDNLPLDTVKPLVRAWLAQNPVTVAYPMAEVNYQTVQFTPIQVLSLVQTDKYTPRLNTVYTDADSIQISYLKSPIRDEYEKTQAILSLGGNS